MVYSEGEVEVILNDAEALKRAGADGLVFGALDTSGTIDKKLCKRFREVSGCVFYTDVIVLYYINREYVPKCIHLLFIPF